MRKHSLNNLNSHQNLKEFLYIELNKKLHFPKKRSLKRNAETKSKKQEKWKEGLAASWFNDLNKENKNKANIQERGYKKTTSKTTKKNSCSYIGSNTSIEEDKLKNF